MGKGACEWMAAEFREGRVFKSRGERKERQQQMGVT